MHPNSPEAGERKLPFTNEIYIDETDFTEDTTLSRKKFKRLVLGEYVRLRGAYVIRADETIKNDSGDVIEVQASIVPNTLGENPPEGIRPRGVIHWVSATESVDCEVRLYDRLFTDEAPDSGDKDFMDSLNPNSLEIIKNAKAEISLQDAKAEQAYQFEREGYFCIDSKHSRSDAPVFNRTIGLKDTWERKI